MTNQKPVCVVTYSTYTYSLQTVTLGGSGRKVQALRQSTQKVTSTDLYDVSNFAVNQAMGQGADDFNIEFSNFLGKYTDFFTPFQEIEVRIGFPTDPNNIVKEELPLIMVGLIEDATPSYTKGEGWHMVVTGRNYASLLIDAKLTDTYHNMSSSAIVQDIIDEYGLGLAADIAQSTTGATYQKVLRTSAKAANAMSGLVSANVNISAADQAIINKYKAPITQTNRYIDDWLFRGKTAWSAIEHLAYLEGVSSAQTSAAEYAGNYGQEFVAYYLGKVFYFGPRQNVGAQQPSTMPQIQVGVGIEHYKFQISTQFLHTRVKIATRLKVNGVTSKNVVYVTAPDDLIVGTDLTQQEMDGFNNSIALFGNREIVLRDRDKILGTDPTKVRWVAKAKLKEYSRLVYTGTLAIVYTAELGNANVQNMTKDRGVVISGVEDVNGQQVTGQEYPQSRRYNGIFYIEKAGHRFTKVDGYRITLTLSSRTPEMTKALSETQISTSQTVVPLAQSKITATQIQLGSIPTN